MNDTPLRRFLERIADLTLVGLFTIAASLPLVTALAALAAATSTLTTAGSGSLPARYKLAFRQHLRSTARPQLILLAAAALGVSDIAVAVWWAQADVTIWLTAPILACGVLLTGAALVLPSHLVALTGSAESVPTRIRAAVALACGRPGVALAVAVAGLGVIILAAALPVFAPLLIGLYAATTGRLIQAGRAHRRPGAAPCPPGTLTYASL